MKIGFTAQRPEARAYAQKQLLLVGSWPGTKEDEQRLHRALEPSLVQGNEWYADTELVAAVVLAKGGLKLETGRVPLKSQGSSFNKSTGLETRVMIRLSEETLRRVDVFGTQPMIAGNRSLACRYLIERGLEAVGVEIASARSRKGRLAVTHRIDIEPQTAASLRAESKCDIRSIKHWWAGRKVRGATAKRLEAAAKRLKIKRPQRRST